ncbi:MAG: rhodanese-like domain-containing protein, partial [Gammaproteobacteria bacterium]
VVIVGLIIWTELKRLNRGYADVTPAEAVQLINREDALVLDVRDGGEFKDGKIRGAKHIPLTSLKTRVSELSKHKDKAIVAYCRVGTRSPDACVMLRKNDFQKVYNMKGGFQGWLTANLPVAHK